MMKRNFKRILFLGTLILGIILRIIWIIKVPTLPFSDFYLYHEGAVSMVQGNGFRIYGYLTAYEPIGYPAFLAILYFFTGPSIFAAKILNLILSCLIMLLTFFLTRKIANTKAALLAMLLVAVVPRSITYTSVLSTEILFTFIFVLLIYLHFTLPKRNISYVIFGILSGMLSLIKPYMLAYPFLLMLILWIVEGKFSMVIVKRFILILTAAVICIVPWTIRNYIVFQEVIPVSTNGGYNLYVNNNPYANGGWQDPFAIQDSPVAKYKHKTDDFWDEVSVDKVGKEYAIKWIVSNPQRFISLGFKKLERAFLMSDDTSWATLKLENGKEFMHQNELNKVAKVINIILLLSLTVFILKLFIRLFLKKDIRKQEIIIILQVAFFVAIFFVFEGQPRYSFPLLPLFALMGGTLINK